MPYAILDKTSEMYVARATKRGLVYTPDVKEAAVYKTKRGCLDAVGELDKSYESMGVGKKKKLVMPPHLQIVNVDISETGDDKNPYDTKNWGT